MRVEGYSVDVAVGYCGDHLEVVWRYCGVVSG